MFRDCLPGVSCKTPGTFMREVYTVSSEQEEEGCAGGGAGGGGALRGARCVLGKGPGYQGKETIKIDSGV